jgi:hypothetical protein
MSECLASGTVTLAIAPEYAVMARLLEEKRAAVVVTERNAAAVADAISRVRDPIQRRNALEAAADFVSQSLTASAMRKTWEEGTAFLKSE